MEAIVDTTGNNDSTDARVIGNPDVLARSLAETAGVRLQCAEGGCGCGGGAGKGPSTTTPVYAIGRIKTRFPTLGIEKELAQVIGRTDTVGQTDWQVVHAVLSRRENRYLARKLCWVMTIEGLETYLVVPRDPADFELLIDTLRPGPRPTDVDVVVGALGPMAPPEMCNGLQVPIVVFDHMYSFDVDTLIKAIPRPPGIPEDKFGATAEEVFYRIMQLADNAGAADEHRALNYLAVRYGAIYATAAEAHGRNAALASVDVRPSRLGGTRKIVDVIFSFTNRATDVSEKFFVRVDVTEQLPFLVSKMTPFVDR
jgi:PatG C-terminal